MTARDGGNAKGLSGTILAHAVVSQLSKKILCMLTFAPVNLGERGETAALLAPGLLARRPENLEIRGFHPH